MLFADEIKKGPVDQNGLLDCRDRDADTRGCRRFRYLLLIDGNGGLVNNVADFELQ